MHPVSTSLMACVICLHSAFTGWGIAAAARLSPPGAESTIQMHCDLCRSPSITDAPPPPSTLEPFRPRQPRGSRPHRRPKGSYTITPHRKHARPSGLGRISGRRLPTSQPIYTIDGDTLRIGSDRIRLRGIDTPELDEPGGLAARQRLDQLLKDGPIRIVPYGLDVYGRTVADILVNGRNVAEVLRQEGYAKPRT